MRTSRAVIGRYESLAISTCMISDSESVLLKEALSPNAMLNLTTNHLPRRGPSGCIASTWSARIANAVWEARKDISLEELRASLIELGLHVSVAGLHRFFARHGMTRKKRLAMPSSRAGLTS